VPQATDLSLAEDKSVGKTCKEEVQPKETPGRGIQRQMRGLVKTQKL